MVLQQTRLDDITGEPGAVTCVITVNGEGVEIDLTEKSIQKLVKTLEPYWKAGTENAYDIQRRAARRAARGGSAPRAPRTNLPDEAERKAIRQWGALNGIKVPVRGVIPYAIVDQYREQNTRAT